MKKTENDEIVIGFSTSNPVWEPVAIAIRLVEGTPYSHVYMRYYAPSLERDMVYQSNIDNVNFTNDEYFSQHNKIIDEYVFKITPEIKKRVLQKCIDRLHLGYGKMQLVGMGLVRLWHRITNKWTKNPFADGQKTQVCSELVGHVLIEMGLDLDEALLEVQGPKWIHENIQKWLTEGKCRKL